MGLCFPEKMSLLPRVSLKTILYLYWSDVKIQRKGVIGSGEQNVTNDPEKMSLLPSIQGKNIYMHSFPYLWKTIELFCHLTMLMPSQHEMKPALFVLLGGKHLDQAPHNSYQIFSSNPLVIFLYWHVIVFFAIKIL